MKVVTYHRITIFILFSLLLSEAKAQKSDFISGRIIDSETFAPVPFATVILKLNRVGVFANADGDFIVPDNKEFYEDSLVISCIGYLSKAIPFSELSAERTNSILIKPAIYNLREIKILANRKYPNPRIVVKKAIRNIKQNYPVKPYSYISYYRDYQKRGPEYINLNEAIVRVSENGFPILSTLNGYTLLGFRNNTEFPRENIFPFYDQNMKYIPNAILPDQGGNEFLILMIHDAIRNNKVNSFSFIHSFSKDFLRNHLVKNITPVFNNNMLLYKIPFAANRGLTGDSLRIGGDIYIQPQNFAIHKIDYSGLFNTKKDSGKEMFNISIEYGYNNPLDSLLYLKYISFSNIFRIIDTASNHYFRVLSSYSYSNNPSEIIVEFNNPVEQSTASNKRNYRIWYGDEIAIINNINISDSQVILNLDPKSISEEKCRVLIRGIKDKNGNLIDEKPFFEYLQFREMFVQKYNKYIAPPGNCHITDKPLQQNCIYNSDSAEIIWMNTPVKNSPVKRDP